MVKELYINDVFIELSDQSRIGLTVQAYTLTNLENKQGSFTNEFFVPRTPSNQTVLESSSNINSDTNIPYQINGVKYIEDGLQVITDGFAVIQSFSKGYQVSVYSGNTDPFALMQSKTLQDLDLSDLDHNFDLATVLATFSNTSGVIYPYVDTRKIGSSLTPANMGRIPFMFIHTLFTRIFAAIGYSLAGDLLVDDYFVNEILSTNFNQNQAWQDSQNSKTTLVADSNITTIVSSPTTTVYGIGFPSSGNIVGGIYTVTESMTAGFTAVIPMRFGLAGSGSQFADIASVDITNITTSTILDADTINPNLDIGVGDERFYTFQVSVGGQVLNIGDQIQIRFAQTYSAIGLYKWAYLAGSEFYASVSPGFIPYLGAAITMSDIQHDMKQKDFVKAVLNQYCAIPQTNTATKVVTLTKLNDITKNIPNAKDWSNKIDVKKGFSVSYRDTSFGRKNLFKYTNDSDVVAKIAENYTYSTDGFLEVDDLSLTEETTVVTLPFSGTYDNVIPYKNNDFSMDKFTPRCMLLTRFYKSGGVTTYYPTSTNARFAFAFNATLSFYKFASPIAESLLDNYEVVQNILDKYKKVSTFFNLNAVDITDADFIIPIYLDVHKDDIQVNGYFYLNKIESYKGGEATKVELIRL
jgi:hypothetical protein